MRLTILIVLCCLAAGIVLVSERHIKSCGPYDIAKDGTCDREGKSLERIATRCMEVIRHPSIRDTPWVQRVRSRWDGTIHQLVDRGGAPAVTTHKSDIRLCLEDASSEDAQLFVCLHELSHIAVDSYGHTDEFWECFSAFIQAAKDAGIYTHDTGAQVCGTKLGGVPGSRDKYNLSGL